MTRRILSGRAAELNLLSHYQKIKYRMRSSLIYLSLALSCLLSVTGSVFATDLRILTWEDYIDPELVARFEEAEGIKVQFVFYEDDDERDLILANTDGAGFDLIIFDAAMTDPYSRHGWLQSLQRDQLPNLKYVYQPLTNTELPDVISTVPYSWGSIGLIYRRDKIHHEPTSWMDIFRPEEQLKGRILVINTAATTFRLAFKALGYSILTSNPEHLRQARELLLAQRSYVRDYRNPLFGEESEILKGDVWMAMIYNGDALTLMESDPNLSFVYPKEGSIVWTDAMAILKKSGNQDAAAKFINYMHDPEVNAQNAEYIQYATSNQAAENLLPEEFRHNAVIYPPLSDASRFEIDQLPASRLMREMTTYFMELSP